MWDAIKKWCMDSETIAYFRAQVVLGVGFLVSGLATADWPLLLAQIQSGDLEDVSRLIWIGVYVMGTGLLGEYLRRRRAPELKQAAK